MTDPYEILVHNVEYTKIHHPIEWKLFDELFEHNWYNDGSWTDVITTMFYVSYQTPIKYYNFKYAKTYNGFTGHQNGIVVTFLDSSWDSSDGLFYTNRSGSINIHDEITLLMCKVLGIELYKSGEAFEIKDLKNVNMSNYNELSIQKH